MTEQKPGDDARTEIIHDLDYPLDVPTSSVGRAEDAPTTSFPGSGSGSGSAAVGSAPTADGADPVGGRPDDRSPRADAQTARIPGASGASGAGTPTAGAAPTTVFPGAYSALDSTGDSGPLPFGEEPALIAPEPIDETSHRGTIDLGLFLLRVAVGVLLGLHGLQKLFGVLDGPGIDGFARILTEAGFRSGTVLAVTGGAVELVAGVMLVIGLATPAAVAALLSMGGMGLAVEIAGPDTMRLFSDTGPALEAQVMYAAALLALLFTGPGRWSADRRWRWSHHPRLSGFVWLLAAVVVAVAVWYLLNGSNPLTSTVDSAPVTTG